jgi:hypothetical protein
MRTQRQHHLCKFHEVDLYISKALSVRRMYNFDTGRNTSEIRETATELQKVVDPL